MDPTASIGPTAPAGTTSQFGQQASEDEMTFAQVLEQAAIAGLQTLFEDLKEVGTEEL